MEPRFGLIDQLTPLPAGSGSLKVTKAASFGPVFEMMNELVSGLPAKAGFGDALATMLRSAN